MHDLLGFVAIVERPKPDTMQGLGTLRCHANPDVRIHGGQGLLRPHRVVLILVGANLHGKRLRSRRLDHLHGVALIW